MSKVIKESFYEASVRIDEEFDNAELAAKSDKPGEKASIKVLDLKHEVSKIRKIIKKEQDVRSESDTGTKKATGGGS